MNDPDRLKAGHFADAWIHVDRTDDPSFFIRFLDATRARAIDLARKDPATAFRHLALRPGLSVLDCGCGTGDMLSLMAEQVAPGRAVGGDISDTMIAEARRRAKTHRASNLSFERLDAQELPYSDRSFDRVLATQLLIHLPEPRRALQEMVRVLSDGGRIALADMDWDTLVTACDDLEIGRRFTHLFSDSIRNGVIVREYPGWLRALGFERVEVLPQPLLFESWEMVQGWILEPALSHFVTRGAMTPEEAEAFRGELSTRSRSGAFFVAATFYTVVGDR